MFQQNRACARFPFLVQSGDALEVAPLLDMGDDECDGLPEAPLHRPAIRTLQPLYSELGRQILEKREEAQRLECRLDLI